MLRRWIFLGFFVGVSFVLVPGAFSGSKSGLKVKVTIENAVTSPLAVEEPVVTETTEVRLPENLGQLNLYRLSDADIQRVKDLLKKLEPVILARDKTHDLATLTFANLYAPLSDTEKKFLRKFQNLDAQELRVRIPFRGFATGEEVLMKITGQKVKILPREKEKFGGLEKRELPIQFLPPDVFAAYQKMNEAMKEDIDRKLYVESGYRSSAYQLYLFVFYLSNHDYSIRETVKFVALPGYSEHGSPKHQAIDFINSDGINGEDNPQEFEELPEYTWLLQNAARFGFVQSYPKTGKVGITYEPWHWRYEGMKGNPSVPSGTKGRRDSGAQQKR